jgi:hypothetical protein
VSLHSGPTDKTNLVIVEPAITRMYWSRRRAWNGAPVVLSVETRWIPDGTELELVIFEDDSAEGSADDAIEEITGPLVIEGGRCVVEHTLKWDAEALGAEMATEGDELEFYFRATIARFGLEARSNLLFVDLTGYRVGR